MSGAETGEVGRSPMADRPTLGPGRHILTMAVPFGWPEAVAYRTGARLFGEGNDAVWVHIRGGQSLHQDLTPEELAATVTLGATTWERWFGLGWARAAEIEEG